MSVQDCSCKLCSLNSLSLGRSPRNEKRLMEEGARCYGFQDPESLCRQLQDQLREIDRLRLEAGVSTTSLASLFKESSIATFADARQSYRDSFPTVNTLASSNSNEFYPAGNDFREEKSSNLNLYVPDTFPSEPESSTRSPERSNECPRNLYDRHPQPVHASGLALPAKREASLSPETQNDYERLLNMPPTPSVFEKNRAIGYQNPLVSEKKKTNDRGNFISKTCGDDYAAGTIPEDNYFAEPAARNTRKELSREHARPLFSRKAQQDQIFDENISSEFEDGRDTSSRKRKSVEPQNRGETKKRSFEASDGSCFEGNSMFSSHSNENDGKQQQKERKIGLIPKSATGQQSMLAFVGPISSGPKPRRNPTNQSVETSRPLKPMTTSPCLANFPTKKPSKLKRNSFYYPVVSTKTSPTPDIARQTYTPTEYGAQATKKESRNSREEIELSPGVFPENMTSSSTYSNRGHYGAKPTELAKTRISNDNDHPYDYDLDDAGAMEDAMLEQLVIETERKLEREKKWRAKIALDIPSTSKQRVFLDDDLVLTEDEMEMINGDLNMPSEDDPEIVDLASEEWLEKEAPRAQPVFNPAASRYDAHGQFRNMLHDDSEKFSSTHPVIETMIQNALKQTFGLNQFRHKQRPAIVAALDNNDCFILMPTGAGKSLCYQLPAVVPMRSVPDTSCVGGKRDVFGVTVVVSPLLSLIEDQVEKMRGINVKAVALTGDLSASETDSIFADFDKYGSQLFGNSSTKKERYPTIRLLYITPEKLEQSGRVLNALKFLHERKLLARIVIDEAHCVSQWGHDFRPDYTKLGSLRNKISEGLAHSVSLMALTATATPKIVSDIKSQLGMKNPQMFISSFCRPELKYVVIKKATRIMEKVIKKLQTVYPNQSGIFYCLSRKECEKVAQSLSKQGIEAEAYHAGLSDTKRRAVQRAWIRGKMKVICATIAFGMGIDKPDVRFLVHYSIPKSLEGYYQETGRAGRDGLPAECILLYAYSDYIRMRRLIEDVDQGKASMPLQVREMHMSNLKQMVNYAENVAVCRRKILLEHFGEVYDEAACTADPETTCDVCRNHSTFRLFDITEDAKLLTNAVCRGHPSYRSENITLNFLAGVYRGPSAQKKIQEKAESSGLTRNPLWGRGMKLNEDEALRVIRQLVLEGILSERLFINQYGGTVCYLERGKFTDQLMAGNRKVHVHFETGKTGGEQLQGRAEMVSEAKAKADRMRGKYGDVSKKCYEALVNLLMQIAEEEKIASCYSILSVEGLQQIAGWLPRTQSDLLRVDTMTEHKLAIYGPQIMGVLRPFWDEVDEKEQKDIEEQLKQLSNRKDKWEGIDRLSTKVVVGNNQAPSNRKGGFKPPMRNQGTFQKKRANDDGESRDQPGSSQRGRGAKRGRKGGARGSKGKGAWGYKKKGGRGGAKNTAIPSKNRDGTSTARGVGLKQDFFPNG